MIEAACESVDLSFATLTSSSSSADSTTTSPISANVAASSSGGRRPSSAQVSVRSGTKSPDGWVKNEVFTSAISGGGQVMSPARNLLHPTALTFDASSNNLDTQYPLDVKTGLSEELCPVCGDKVSGYHYGLLTCESCKGFFKRTVQNKKAYSCVDNRQCHIDKSQRKRCPFCRFQKCLSVGMRLEAVRQDRMRGGRNKFGPMYKRDRALKQQQFRAQQRLRPDQEMIPGSVGLVAPPSPPDIKPDPALLHFNVGGLGGYANPALASPADISSSIAAMAAAVVVAHSNNNNNNNSSAIRGAHLPPHQNHAHHPHHHPSHPALESSSSSSYLLQQAHQHYASGGGSSHHHHPHPHPPSHHPYNSPPGDPRRTSPPTPTTTTTTPTNSSADDNNAATASPPAVQGFTGGPPPHHQHHHHHHNNNNNPPPQAFRPNLPPLLGEISANLMEEGTMMDIMQKFLADTMRHMEGGSLSHADQLLRVICRLVDQLLFLMVEWARSTPFFREIQVEDQMKLLQSSWSQILILDFVYRQVHEYWASELVLPNGSRLNFDTLETLELREVRAQLQELIKKTKELKLDYNEYMCLKFLILLNPDISGLENRHYVEESQEKVNLALQEYCQRFYPSLRDKFSQILLSLTEICIISVQVENFLYYKHLNNQVPDQTLLTEMLHSRRK
ncbi:hypothetical protein ACOMHN_043264 [Nucella lapillus]